MTNPGCRIFTAENLEKPIEPIRQRPEEAQILSEMRKRARRDYTSLPEKDVQVTFDSLEIIPQNSEPLARLKRWTPDHKKGVLLYGPVGTGKSTACKAVINRFASKDFRCLFISVADAMQRLRDTIDSKETNMTREMEKLLLPNLLILDDLGAEKASDWASEKLFVIFEKRAAQEKPTFFTTNLLAKEISHIYRERITDRLMEFCFWINFPGESFRKKNYHNVL